MLIYNNPMSCAEGVTYFNRTLDTYRFYRTVRKRIRLVSVIDNDDRTEQSTDILFYIMMKAKFNKKSKMLEKYFRIRVSITCGDIHKNDCET